MPMQTLNVGAGQTDVEYKAAEEQRRADLLADSRADANYFFIAAGLAALGTGLLPIKLNVFVTIGAVDLFAWYGRELVRSFPLAVQAAALVWILILMGLGWAALKGQRWAFIAGVVLYSADIIALTVLFSFWSIGVHGFFIFKWFQGQRTLQDLKDATVSR